MGGCRPTLTSPRKASQHKKNFGREKCLGSGQTAGQPLPPPLPPQKLKLGREASYYPGMVGGYRPTPTSPRKASQHKKNFGRKKCLGSGQTAGQPLPPPLSPQKLKLGREASYYPGMVGGCRPTPTSPRKASPPIKNFGREKCLGSGQTAGQPLLP